MTQDITSKPIKWLMLTSAICLVVFLFKFTNNSLTYIDRVYQEADQSDTVIQEQINDRRAEKKHNIFPINDMIEANSP